MKNLLLTFDLEEFIPKEFGIKENLNGLEISKKGIIKIINLLKKYKIKATFFVTLKFANAYPKIINDIIKQGHEIGVHAYEHNHRYNQMKFSYLRLSRIEYPILII